MGYYNTPEEMFNDRADHFERDAKRHWAMAKSGCGDFHYAKARFCFEQSAANREKAAYAHETDAQF